MSVHEFGDIVIARLIPGSGSVYLDSMENGVSNDRTVRRTNHGQQDEKNKSTPVD